MGLAAVGALAAHTPARAQSNTAPSVSLTAPTDGATVLLPSNITLRATASDADGSVARVDFYAGTTLLRTDSTRPYSRSWTPSAVGTYLLTAVAVDDRGAVTTSATRTLTVVANTAPSVSLTSPTVGAKVLLPATVVLSATASDSDGTVTRVEFYAGATLLMTDATSPYLRSWTPAAVGTYVLKATAVDDRGAVTTSATRTITVVANTAPSVSLTAPAAGASYTAPATIALTATASDTDGTITQVEFYAGATLVGTDTTNPYSVTWTGAGVGAYSLTAVARDNSSAVTVSGGRDILVTSSGLPTTAIFTPSGIHDVIDRYVLEIYPAGADPDVASPLATQDLGRPTVVDGECSADVRAMVFLLASGSYFGVVSAVNIDGTFRSSPSPPFSR